MIFFLLKLIFSSSSFNNYVDHILELPPNDGKPYFIMIHSDGCAHCDRLAPTWSTSAELGAGIAKFGELNCNLNRSACQELGIDSVPRLLYFRNGKILEYTGMQISRLIVNWASDLLEDSATIITINNYSQYLTPKSAILFTNKYPYPKIWSAIEKYANYKDLNFFISSDINLLKLLSLEKFPGVYFKKNDQVVHYDKKLSSVQVKEFIEEFYGNNKEL